RTFKHISLDEARNTEGIAKYQSELHYIEEYFLNIGYRNLASPVTKNIIEVFWDNVDWHVKDKNIELRQSYETARKKRAGINLRTVGDIARNLDIDDYAILFEVNEYDN
uniref:hypothetical protein n=1 Tax=Serratia quinivorans TaxID=137545 RepID=UPI0035C728AF